MANFASIQYLGTTTYTDVDAGTGTWTAGEVRTVDEVDATVLCRRADKFKYLSNADAAYATDASGNVTGLVDTSGNNAGFISDSNNRDVFMPKTLTGTYTGNGTTQSVSVGFRPTLVIVKGNTTQAAVYASESSFMLRTDHFTNINSMSEEFGITITDTGFTVGNDNKVNGNTIAYYYFAYCDNGSDNLLQANWAGNAQSGRTVELFKRRKIAGIIAKRDSAKSAVWIVGDKASNYWYNGTSNAISTGTTLDSETGILTVGAGDEINQWSGLLGEGVVALALAKESEAVHVMTYTGTGAARSITLPFEPECVFLMPRDTTVATSRIWISSFPAGNWASLSTTGLGTGEFSVSGSKLTFSGATQNATGLEYAIFAFRKLRNTTYFPRNQLPIMKRKSVELVSGGYIDCGTSDTLKISGAITMEWFGTVYCPDKTQYTGSADIDTAAGNQDKLTPLIFRSSGADMADGAVSFGMAVAAGTVSVDSYRDASLLVAPHDYWGMLQSNASGDLDNHPIQTGYVIRENENVHIVATHAGNGHWAIYVNGDPVKERKRDTLLASTPRANVTGYIGHKTVIGGRLRDGSIVNANGCSVRLARIYSRALTEHEVKNNYLSLFGKANEASDFVEQWDASNATGTTLIATNNVANNGTIVSGTIY